MRVRGIGGSPQTVSCAVNSQLSPVVVRHTNFSTQAELSGRGVSKTLFLDEQCVTEMTGLCRAVHGPNKPCGAQAE